MVDGGTWTTLWLRVLEPLLIDVTSVALNGLMYGAQPICYDKKLNAKATGAPT